MIRLWLCQRLPWHHWVIEKHVSEQSRKLTCSCGRHYACNDAMGVILPWDDEFAEMYARFERRRTQSHPSQTRSTEAG